MSFLRRVLGVNVCKVVDQFLLEGVVNFGKLFPEILAFGRVFAQVKESKVGVLSLLTNACQSGVNSLPTLAQSL